MVFDQSWTQTRNLETVSCTVDAPPSHVERSGASEKTDEAIRILPFIPPSFQGTGGSQSSNKQTGAECKPGGYCPVNIHSRDVREMASFAVSEISKSSNSGPQRLVRIISAHTQVVSGRNYKINLQLSGSDGSQLCVIKVYDQPWTRTRKLESVNCTPDAAPPSRLQRVGGYTPADTENETVKEMAAFAVTEITRSSNSGPLTLIAITSVSKQVVSGINYKIGLRLSTIGGVQNCQTVVYHQSWTGKRKLTSFNCVPEAAPVQSRGSYDPAAGSYSTAETENETVKEMASFAVAELSKSSNSGPLTLIAITSVSKQVVSGINYKIGLRLSTIGGVQNCEVVVYDQSWTGRRKLTSFNCVPEAAPARLTEIHDRPIRKLGGFRPSSSSPEFTEFAQRPHFVWPKPVEAPHPFTKSRRRRSLDVTGGVTPIDIHSDKVKQLADLSVSTIGQRSNEPSDPQLLQVLAATQQLVSGIKYNLNIKIGYANCTENSKTCLRNEICSVSIVEQPWLQRQQVTQLTCKTVKKSLLRTKLFGGIKPIDPRSEETQSYAAFALESIQDQSNSDQLLSIVRIKNAAKQTVSGQKIYLTIEIGATRCLKNETDTASCTVDDAVDHQLCKIEIWSRPWLNERKVSDVKCATISSNLGRSKRQAKKFQSRNMKKRLEHMTAFRSYARTFKKVYTTWKEFEHRYKIYRANQKQIELLNRNEMGTAVYGDTLFSDWTQEEFKERLNGMKPHLRNEEARLSQAVIPDVDLPKAFDWREHNAVTPVKDQGQCGSCWAFSVTGNVEGVYSAKYGELVSLSEQELVDCDTLDSGCNGGLPENAYKAIHDLGGLELETDYPYNGHENKCHFNASIARVQVTKFVKFVS